MSRPHLSQFDRKLSKMLKTNRTEQGLSMERIGRHLGVTRIAIHYIENNACRMTAKQLITLAVFFGWDLNHLKKYVRKAKGR